MVAHKMILSLGEARVAEVKDVLAKGWRTSDVADKIQKEWGQLTDKKTHTVRMALQRFRKEVVHKELTQQVAAKMALSPARSVKVRLDSMLELEELADTQKKRIEKLLAREKDMPHGAVIGSLRDEIRVLGDLLKKLGDLQLETGALRRAPKQVEILPSGPGGLDWTDADRRLLSKVIDVDYEEVDKPH